MFIYLLKCNSSLRFLSEMPLRHNELWLIKLNGFTGTSLTENDLTHHPLASSPLLQWCSVCRPYTHTHIQHLCGGIGASRYFPNGKAHCEKITVKPASALSNYFTVSAQMRQSLFTLQWNLWPLMTDCISPPHSTLSLLKVTQQHINFSTVIISSAVTCWKIIKKKKNSDEESLILVVLISSGNKCS